MSIRYNQLWPWEKYTCYCLHKKFKKIVLEQKGKGPFEMRMYDWWSDWRARKYEYFINSVENRGYKLVYDDCADVSGNNGNGKSMRSVMFIVKPLTIVGPVRK